MLSTRDIYPAVATGCLAIAMAGLLALTVGASAVSAASVSGPQTVVLVDASAAPEGSPLECVRRLVAQGVTVTEAIDACIPSMLGMAERPTIHSFLGLGGLGTGTKAGSVTCSSGGTDPRRGADYDWTGHPDRNAPPNPGEDKLGGWAGQSEYVNRKADAQDKWAAYADKLDEWANSLQEHPENLNPNELAKIEQLRKEANEAIDKRDAWQPNTTQTDPDAVDSCLEAKLFVAECNVNGWTSPACREALWRMEGCSDPAVTDPSPESPIVCGDPSVDHETAVKGGSLVCHMKTMPVPGEDPCVPVEATAPLLKGYVRLSDADETSDEPCGDPRALTGEDQCLGTLSVVQFSNEDIQSILNTALEKLGGGPVFVVPLPPKDGPVDPPKPS